MTPGDKVSVPSTIYENKRVSGVLLEIAPMSPGQRTTHFSYRVKTNEGVSYYSRDEIEVDRRDGLRQEKRPRSRALRGPLR